MRSDLYYARATSHRCVIMPDRVEAMIVLFCVADKHARLGEVPWVGRLREPESRQTLLALRRAGWDGRDLKNLPGLGSREVEVAIVARSVDGGARVPRVAAIFAKGTAGVGWQRSATGSEMARLEERLRGEHGPAFTNARTTATNPSK